MAFCSFDLLSRASYCPNLSRAREKARARFRCRITIKQVSVTCHLAKMLMSVDGLLNQHGPGWSFAILIPFFISSVYTEQKSKRRDNIVAPQISDKFIQLGNREYQRHSPDLEDLKLAPARIKKVAYPRLQNSTCMEC